MVPIGTVSILPPCSEVRGQMEQQLWMLAEIQSLILADISRVGLFRQRGLNSVYHWRKIFLTHAKTHNHSQLSTFTGRPHPLSCELKYVIQAINATRLHMKTI